MGVEDGSLVEFDVCNLVKAFVDMVSRRVDLV
jgi:hypothetical protein